MEMSIEVSNMNLNHACSLSRCSFQSSTRWTGPSRRRTSGLQSGFCGVSVFSTRPYKLGAGPNVPAMLAINFISLTKFVMFSCGNLANAIFVVILGLSIWITIFFKVRYSWNYMSWSLTLSLPPDAYMRQYFHCLQWYAGSERVNWHFELIKSWIYNKILCNCSLNWQWLNNWQ